ncbi:MAG TPA: hypothetical protein VIM85_04345, partial [Pseudomonadales bacterium]
DKLPKAVARKAVKQSEQVLESLIKTANETAVQQVDETIKAALKTMQAEQQAELERLEELKVINPAIKPEELEFVKQQTRELQQCIENSKGRLDALRVIYAG